MTANAFCKITTDAGAHCFDCEVFSRGCNELFICYPEDDRVGRKLGKNKVIIDVKVDETNLTKYRSMLFLRNENENKLVQFKNIFMEENKYH